MNNARRIDMKKNININKIAILAIIFILIYQIRADAGTVLYIIDTNQENLCRILDGLSPNDVWIVEPGIGLGNLIEVQPDVWEYNEYVTNSGQDACGPDSNGYIYMSTYSIDYPGGGFQIFDCDSKIIIDTILLCQDFPVHGLTISNDETKLYVTGRSWPRFGEGGSFGQGFNHPDTGIVWEVDLTSQSYDVLTLGYTAALPETIFYEEVDWQNDRLYVYCAEIYDSNPQYGLLDVLSVERALPRLEQIQCPAQEWKFVNAIIDWSDSDPLIALCAEDIHIFDNAPEYLDGLWIINTETNQVVETIQVTSSYGYPMGVSYALVSQVNPGLVYISPGLGGYADELIVMDYDTHEIVDYISFTQYDRMVPWFIYEMSDGRLIITSGSNGKIAIVDPVG